MYRRAEFLYSDTNTETKQIVVLICQKQTPTLSSEDKPLSNRYAFSLPRRTVSMRLLTAWAHGYPVPYTHYHLTCYKYGYTPLHRPLSFSCNICAGRRHFCHKLFGKRYVFCRNLSCVIKRKTTPSWFCSRWPKANWPIQKSSVLFICFSRYEAQGQTCVPKGKILMIFNKKTWLP